MCNQLAIHIHCRPGEEIIAHRTAHILNFEGGGTAAFSGAQVQGLDGARGQFSVEAAQAAIRPKDRYHPQTRMIAVEQTANMGGGAIWRSEEHTSELQSLMRNSYAVFCLKKKNELNTQHTEKDQNDSKI